MHADRIRERNVSDVESIGGSVIERIGGKVIYATMMLTPAGRIAACDDGALCILGCAAGDLLSRSVTVIAPDLPLLEHAPSENVRYVNQFGAMTLWRPIRGRGIDGRSIPIEILLGRCGFRASAALCLFFRQHIESWRDLDAAPTGELNAGAAMRMHRTDPRLVTVHS